MRGMYPGKSIPTQPEVAALPDPLVPLAAVGGRLRTLGGSATTASRYAGRPASSAAPRPTSARAAEVTEVTGTTEVNGITEVTDPQTLADPGVPRWAVTSAAEAFAGAVAHGIPVRRSWDIAEAHRLLAGGWRGDLAAAAAYVHGLPEPPMRAEIDHAGTLFDEFADDPPSQATSDSDHATELLATIADVAKRQRKLLAKLGPRCVATAYSESAAAVLALELARDGLPVDRRVAESLIATHAGPRPRDAAHVEAIRRERDDAVLRHVPGRRVDLRQPADVKELLAGVGIDVPTTRAWVLEPYRQSHPVVDAFLRWRKDERIATTYGYRWLDEHVGPDGRLRGAWTACDGAAGRMTAQNGLHNLPGGLRRAVVAEPGFVFVRADLGQIEPRVLAAVSGDRAFAAATQADDLYAPVAATLHVERAVAKIAVLAAMYGQRSGAAGEALRGLERAFPTAMGVLDEAYAVGVHGGELRTFGGRLIRVGVPAVGTVEEATRAQREHDAARGRYARNALIQGSAAELFKAWAVTVRHAIRPLGATIVLCLHDELLIHAPEPEADRVAAAVHESLRSSAYHWLGSEQVRFVADVSVITCWADAKG